MNFSIIIKDGSRISKKEPSLLKKLHESPKVPLFFFKMNHPRPLFVYFALFKKTFRFLQQIYAIKCPSSIRRWDSNTRQEPL